MTESHWEVTILAVKFLAFWKLRPKSWGTNTLLVPQPKSWGTSLLRSPRLLRQWPVQPKICTHSFLQHFLRLSIQPEISRTSHLPIVLSASNALKRLTNLDLFYAQHVQTILVCSSQSPNGQAQTDCLAALITSCAGGRHNMPRPLSDDLWPFDVESGVRVECDVGYIGANF